MVIPCKLVELAPVTIIAEPWSSSPKLIYFNRGEIFVDDANDARATQLASALKEYGLSKQDCAAFEENGDVAKRLVESLNHSYYEESALPTERTLASRRKQ